MNPIPEAMAALRWNLIIRVSGQVISWALTFLVMRLLTPADYGLLAMATVFLNYAAMLADMGLSAAVVQTAEINERKLQEVLGVALAMNFGVGLLFLAAAPAIAMFYGEPQIKAIMPALAVQFLFNGLMVIPRGLAQRKLDFRMLSLVQFGATLGGAGVTVMLAMAGKGVWALVLGNLVNILIQVVGLNAAFPFLKRPLFSLGSARHMVAFGARVTGAGLLWGLWSDADTLIAGAVLGKTALGTYSIGAQLASMPLSRFGQTITQVAFPAFSRLQHDRDAIRFNVLRSVRILAITGVPVMWGMSCVAPELIAVAIGPRWAAAVLPLRLLALIMPLRLMGLFVSAVVRGSGRADVDLNNTLLVVVIMPAALFAGSRWGGLTGLSLAWVTVYPLVFLWNAWNLFGALGIRLREPLGAMLRPVAAAACMCVVTVGIRWWCEPRLAAIPRLAILTLSGAAVYFGLVWMMDRASLRSTIKLFRAVATGGTQTA